MKELFTKIWNPVFANDLDAFIPEVWAQESLMVLEANMVAANLVHRDFEDEIAMFGDTVNTRRPATFTGKRKVDTDDVTIQDATATNVPVVLNQHLHTSFLIRDGEESKGFKALRQEYLVPAIQSIAQMVDEVVLGQVYDFQSTLVGKLGTDITKATVIAAREAMNTNKVPLVGRNIILTPNAEGDLLEVVDFTNAEKIGDDGTAMREGSLGRKMGFDFFMSQNAPSVATGSTVVTGAVNEAGGSAIGDTTITVDGLSAAIAAGSWCTIAGDMTPQMITATVGGATPTELTISPGLRSAIVDDAVVTIYTPGAVNLGAGYAAGYGKTLVVDGFSVAPKIGQMVSFGATAGRYSALSTPTTTALDLSRPLDASVADDAVVGLGPAGDYSFAFHRNAISLVTRPLAPPAEGTGALSFVANYNGLAVRVTITYNGEKQGHLVTVDLLCGVKTLDTSLGCMILG